MKKKFTQEDCNTLKKIGRRTLVETPFGKCLVLTAYLKKGCIPTIQTAINKTQYIINQFKSIHGGQYDYSLVEYKNTKTKVKIICPKHGEFEITPSNHLRSNGCAKCVHDSLRGDTESFIKKAKEIHGNKYDYSLVHYIDSKTGIKIFCNTHKEYFYQTPGNHLMKHGCQKCAGNLQSNTPEFIEKSIKIHGGLYNYSKVDYVRQSDKVSIICKNHGVFKQSPNSHLAGRGCPKCASENAHCLTKKSFVSTCEGKGKGIFYLLECKNNKEKFFKIGITSDTVKKRYASGIKIPYKYNILISMGSVDVESIYEIEKILKKALNPFKYVPNIPFGGSQTECFESCDEVYSIIYNYINNN